MDKSFHRAMEILDLHKVQLTENCAEALLSVVLVCSLTNGSYTGGPGSDIDLVHILKPNAPADARAAVLRCIGRTEALSHGDLPISRCVYRLEDLSRPYCRGFEWNRETMDHLELPIEVLRMKDSGITVYGRDILRQIERPTREDVLEMLRRCAQWDQLQKERDPQWADERERMLTQPTLRILAQCVLTRAMLHLFLATGQSCSSKKEIAARIRTHVPNYRFQELLDLSARWRYQPDTLTLAEQENMRTTFQTWRSMMAGNPIGFVPLAD